MQTILDIAKQALALAQLWHTPSHNSRNPVAINNILAKIRLKI